MKKKFLLLGLSFCLFLLVGCGKKITLDEAKNIALQDASLTASEVAFTNIEHDDDFTLEFHTVDTNYIYVIREDGTIEEMIKRYMNYPSADTPDSGDNTNDGTTDNGTADNGTTGDNSSTTTKISLDEARDIALKYFNFSLNEVRDLNIEEEMERGLVIYEVSFEKDRVEYSCDIYAVDGTVLKSDIDY